MHKKLQIRRVHYDTEKTLKISKKFPDSMTTFNDLICLHDSLKVCHKFTSINDVPTPFDVITC